MSLLKVCNLLSSGLVISACSVSSSSMPPSITPSTTQVETPPIKISCQDLQNPAYQQAVLKIINQIRQQSRQCGQQYYRCNQTIKLE